MSRLFYHVMQDNAGNLLFDVSGTVRLAGTGTAATIYGDAALTVPIANPMTNHPSFGSFKCYLGAGNYDFYMAKSGYTFETLTGLQGWGTMALQDASAVAITGGSIINTPLSSLDRAGNDLFVINSALNTAGGSNRHFLVHFGDAKSEIRGPFEFGYKKDGFHALTFYPTDNNTGTTYALLFQNLASGTVGGIFTNATTTAYQTTSDARLKDAVEPLSGALDVVRALNPVAYRWKIDGSPGRGFLAHEVQEVIPDGVITGDRDAMNPDGTISPQQIDYSKLVPYLIGAVKELTQQVEMLQAQVAAAGA